MPAAKGSVPWNAGKGAGWVNKRGYREVYVDTPAGRRARKEHRVVMEQMIGRPLTKGEHVHHINGDKTDNRPENLELLSAAEHSRHHNSERRYRKGYKKQCRNKRCIAERAEMAALLAMWSERYQPGRGGYPPIAATETLLSRIRGEA